MAVGAGHAHSILVKEDGSVWTTGHNAHGQLGDGTTTDQHSFVEVEFHGAKAVAAGYGTSMVLAYDGNVWAAGWNFYGQFGDGSTGFKKVFENVARLRKITASLAPAFPTTTTALITGTNRSVLR